MTVENAAAGGRQFAIGTGASVVVDRCQVCGNRELEAVLFIGFMPPVNEMQAIGTTPSERPAYPAQWLYCGKCELVQLGLSLDPQILFPPGYPYTSGTTRILRENFAQLYREAAPFVGLAQGDLVIDIGSNDGTLLSNFHAPGHRVLGIEPTNVGKIAQSRGIDTVQAYFRPEIARRVRDEHGPAKIVTATNCFAHIEDVHPIVDGILDLLAPDGVFISESHYLMKLMETLQYDTIYHEHLRYYSVHSLKHLLEMHGLEVIHCVPIPTHGGSIRVYAARKGARPVQSLVAATLASEPTGDEMRKRLRQFRADVIQSKLRLSALLNQCRNEGARICAISAPSRASTLINYVGLDDGIIDYVAEIKGSLKIGKYMPGTLIPVVEESRIFEDQPEYALMLSWHIADELIPKLRQNGYKGMFIVPLPVPRVV